MWGLNFDEKEKHSSWLFSYALIGKLLGARYGGGGAVSLEKNRACQLAWEQDLHPPQMYKQA